MIVSVKIFSLTEGKDSRSPSQVWTRDLINEEMLTVWPGHSVNG